MAELLQLDAAASLIGKSEVTLRRLIKANKIPYQKDKTLTGFIYRVDPEVVKAYYQNRDADLFNGEDFAQTTPPPTKEAEESKQEAVSTPINKSMPIRIAVADTNGTPEQYWQKRSEMYEDRYNQEMHKHAQTREDLGVWRGRAEQAQSMLVKLLPSPQETEASANEIDEVPRPANRNKDTTVSTDKSNNVATNILIGIVFVLVIGVGFLAYVYLMHH